MKRKLEKKMFAVKKQKEYEIETKNYLQVEKNKLLTGDEYTKSIYR